MGKKTKAHRKKVAKRNQRIQEFRNKLKKTYKQMLAEAALHSATNPEDFEITPPSQSITLTPTSGSDET